MTALIEKRVDLDPKKYGVKQMTDHQTCEDGFAGFGRGQDGSSRIIQGDVLHFGNDGIWRDRSIDVVFPPTRDLVMVEIARVVQKWINKMPVGTRFVPPSEPLPDIDALNADCPKSEWGVDLNNLPRGPWQAQILIYLVDLETMDKFTYPTGTVGGNIAVGEVADKVRMIRRLRGGDVYPVVNLKSKPMKTKFGQRPRPFFEVQRWITLGGGEQTLPSPSPPTLPAAHDETTSGIGGIVEEPSAREEMNDDIPF